MNKGMIKLTVLMFTVLLVVTSAGFTVEGDKIQPVKTETTIVKQEEIPQATKAPTEPATGEEINFGTPPNRSVENLGFVIARSEATWRSHWYSISEIATSGCCRTRNDENRTFSTGLMRGVLRYPTQQVGLTEAHPMGGVQKARKNINSLIKGKGR